MDVHVNHIPASGTVTKISYTPGKFLPACPTGSRRGQRAQRVWIERVNGQMVVARQVVGILARRVVCRARVGEQVRRAAFQGS
jgi:phosphatidylserine decarboxylase